jgi:hypothetical protein
MPVLNSNIRAFNSYTKSSKLYNLNLVACISSLQNNVNSTKLAHGFLYHSSIHRFNQCPLCLIYWKKALEGKETMGHPSLPLINHYSCHSAWLVHGSRSNNIGCDRTEFLGDSFFLECHCLLLAFKVSSSSNAYLTYTFSHVPSQAASIRILCLVWMVWKGHAVHLSFLLCMHHCPKFKYKMTKNLKTVVTEY